MITVVGCGFLGGLFVEEIAKRSFAYHEPIDLCLIDPDEIEERNAANQIWVPAEGGKSKVNTLGYRILKGYGLDCTAMPVYLTKDNIKDLLLATDFLVCAVDNIPTRQLLWEQAVAMDIPLLNMGISQGGTGVVEWTHMSKGIDTNTFSPIRLAGLSEERITQMGQVANLPPCELVGFRGLGLNVALAAAKALWIYMGWDAEKEVFSNAQGAPGTMTTWTATNKGHSLGALLK